MYPPDDFSPNWQIEGLSLIELMVFVSIVSIVLVTALAFMSATSRQARVNFHRVYATTYAQQAIEWIRARHDDDWTAFTSTLDAHGSVDPSTGLLTGTYCMNSNLSLTSSFTSGNASTLDTRTCGYDGIVGSTGPTIFRRQLTYHVTASGSYIIEVDVAWQEAGGTNYHVPIKTSLSAP